MKINGREAVHKKTAHRYHTAMICGVQSIEEMMIHPHRLADVAPTEAQDPALVPLAQSGSKEALGLLITRHQRWIYNIALRIVFLPQNAEDATQEILVKVITKLSTHEPPDFAASRRTLIERTGFRSAFDVQEGPCR